MTSTRSTAGTGLHFPPSLDTDDNGVIVAVPGEALPEIAAAVEPGDLLFFAQRLIKGTVRRRRQPRWSAVNKQRLELASLCIMRALADPVPCGMVPT